MNSIKNILDLLDIINEYYQMLDGFAFDNQGWPIFNNSDFITEWPTTVVPFDNRNSKLVKSKETTLLCHFTSDKQIYRRFLKIENDIKIYQEYLGAAFPDITVTKDMDLELQNTIMLANQLYAAVLVKNGIKLSFNTRNGIYDTQNNFKNIPTNIMCISSFLGCDNSKNNNDTAEYINKILRLRPYKLLIYGKKDRLINAQLDSLGINYRYYDDYRRRCFKEAV